MFESMLKEYTGAEKIVWKITTCYSDNKSANTLFNKRYYDPDVHYSDTYEQDPNISAEEAEISANNGIYSFLDILKTKERMRNWIFGNGEISAEIGYN
jgi:hypothetical protein